MSIREQATQLFANDAILEAFQRFRVECAMCDRMVDSFRGMVDTGVFVPSDGYEEVAFVDLLEELEDRHRSKRIERLSKTLLSMHIAFYKRANIHAFIQSILFSACIRTNRLTNEDLLDALCHFLWMDNTRQECLTFLALFGKHCALDGSRDITLCIDRKDKGYIRYDTDKEALVTQELIDLFKTRYAVLTPSACVVDNK